MGLKRCITVLWSRLSTGGTSDRSYVVVPAKYTYKQHRKPAKETGTLTITMACPIAAVHQRWLRVNSASWAVGPDKAAPMAGLEQPARRLPATFGQCWPATHRHKAVIRNVVVTSLSFDAVVSPEVLRAGGAIARERNNRGCLVGVHCGAWNDARTSV